MPEAMESCVWQEQWVKAEQNNYAAEALSYTIIKGCQ